MRAFQSVLPGTGVDARVVTFARCCFAQSSRAACSAESWLADARAIHSGCCEIEGRLAGRADRVNARRLSTCVSLKRAIAALRSTFAKRFVVVPCVVARATSGCFTRGASARTNCAGLAGGTAFAATESFFARVAGAMAAPLEFANVVVGTELAAAGA